MFFKNSRKYQAHVFSFLTEEKRHKRQHGYPSQDERDVLHKSKYTSPKKEKMKEKKGAVLDVMIVI